MDFLVETVASDVSDKSGLKQVIAEDEDFLTRFVSDDKVFQRAMGDEEILLKISPGLFFEILLRRAVRDLKEMSYTVEKTTTMHIPVFDTRDVVALLSHESLLIYLADMLSSFTRVRSYSVSFRIRKGTWKKVRFNDMDIHSLISFCEVVDEDERFGLYKRIADICLFVLGAYPYYAERGHRYPVSGVTRPSIPGRMRFSPEEYEKEGRKFYELAARHRRSHEMKLSQVFLELHRHFQSAKKPLNYISDRFLRYRQVPLFA
jgi:hypothetical protein